MVIFMGNSIFVCRFLSIHMVRLRCYLEIHRALTRQVKLQLIMVGSMFGFGESD